MVMILYFLRNGLLGSIYGFQNYILSGCKNCHLGTGKIKGHLLFYFHLRSFVFLQESYGVNTMNKLAMIYLSLSLPISWVFPKNPYVWLVSSKTQSKRENQPPIYLFIYLSFSLFPYTLICLIPIIIQSVNFNCIIFILWLCIYFHILQITNAIIMVSNNKYRISLRKRVGDIN